MTANAARRPPVAADRWVAAAATATRAAAAAQVWAVGPTVSPARATLSAAPPTPRAGAGPHRVPAARRAISTSTPNAASTSAAPSTPAAPGPVGDRERRRRTRSGGERRRRGHPGHDRERRPHVADRGDQHAGRQDRAERQRRRGRPRGRRRGRRRGRARPASPSRRWAAAAGASRGSVAAPSPAARASQPAITIGAPPGQTKGGRGSQPGQRERDEADVAARRWGQQCPGRDGGEQQAGRHLPAVRGPRAHPVRSTLARSAAQNGKPADEGAARLDHRDRGDDQPPRRRRRRRRPAGGRAARPPAAAEHGDGHGEHHGRGGHQPDAGYGDGGQPGQRDDQCGGGQRGAGGGTVHSGQ